MGENILDYCIKAASGEIIPKAVQLLQDDFIPWKRGVSLKMKLKNNTLGDILIINFLQQLL